MSTSLIGLLAAIALAVLGVMSLYVKDEKVEAFGQRIHAAGAAGRKLAKTASQVMLGVLMLALAVPTVGAGDSPGDLKRLESSHHGFTHIVYLIDLVLAGIFGVLLGVAILFGVAFLVLSAVAWGLKRTPPGKFVVGWVLGILTVGVAVAFYILSD